jgi:tetratricopeptide (TPR) repeat protein
MARRRSWAIEGKEMSSTKWLRERYRYLNPSIRQLLMEDKSPYRKPHRSYESRLRSALKKHPNTPPLVSSLMRLLRKGKRYTEVIQIWHRFKRRLRNKSSSYFQRATWAMEARKYPIASHFLNLCIRTDTGYFGETAHFWRAFALYRLNKNTEALKHLQSVSDDYSEPYFFGQETWSKVRLRSEMESQKSATMH